jgi:hypothetical protein
LRIGAPLVLGRSGPGNCSGSLFVVGGRARRPSDFFAVILMDQGRGRSVAPIRPILRPQTRYKGRGCYAPARVSQPPKPGHIGQTLNAREFSYSTCCTLQPLVARQFRGRGFGLESTADVLLTKPSIRTSWASPFYGFCRKNREPRSGLEPLT